MNKRIPHSQLLLFTLCSGVLGFLLNLLLHLDGTDDRGLLVSGHLAGVLLLILCALTLLGLLWLVRMVRDRRSYAAAFPPSVPAALSCWVATVAIVITSLRELAQQDTLTRLCAVLAILAGISLAIVGWCRLRKRKPSFLFFTVLTVYCMLHLICQYRIWSAEPQLLNYFFPLVASVFLMLTAYEATRLAAGDGSCRWYTFFSLGALFLCCVSLYSESFGFYLPMALWTASSQCAEPARRSREG